MLRKAEAWRRAEVVVVPVVLGMIIGFSGALYLYAFKALAGLRETLIEEWSFSSPILAIAGILASGWIVTRYSKLKFTGSGGHLVMYTYHVAEGEAEPADYLLFLAASLLTISLGGSAGLEGPAMVLGGVSAWLVARTFHLPRARLKALFLAGAGAGLAAIFKAPITGVVFSLEMPYLFDIYKEPFLPAVIASVTAFLISTSLTGGGVFHNFASRQIHASLLDALGVGLLRGIVGLTFVKLYKYVSRRRKIRIYRYIMLAVLAAILFFYPVPGGAGYEVIAGSSSSNIPLTMALLLLLGKMLATSLTLNSGGCGGLCIPTLFAWAILGNIYSTLTHTPLELAVPMAMASMLAATNKTLLTSLLFVAESTATGNLMYVGLASAVSYFASGLESFE